MNRGGISALQRGIARGLGPDFSVQSPAESLLCSEGPLREAASQMQEGPFRTQICVQEDPECKGKGWRMMEPRG